MDTLADESDFKIDAVCKMHSSRALSEGVLTTVRIIHRITTLSYSLWISFQLLEHDCPSEREQKNQKNLPTWMSPIGPSSEE